MPVQRRWLVLRAFEWSPRANVVITFRAGQECRGLTRACRAAAGDRIREIRE
jgi:hypothetical protein